MQGHRSLLSSPWYLNLGTYGEENWQRYHAVEPLAFQVTAANDWALCSLLAHLQHIPCRQPCM